MVHPHHRLVEPAPRFLPEHIYSIESALRKVNTHISMNMQSLRAKLLFLALLPVWNSVGGKKRFFICFVVHDRDGQRVNGCKMVDIVALIIIVSFLLAFFLIASDDYCWTPWDCNNLLCCHLVTDDSRCKLWARLVVHDLRLNYWSEQICTRISCKLNR